MTPEEREELVEKRDHILQRVEQLETEMEEHILSREQVNDILTREFGSDYWLQLESADKELRKERQTKNVVVSAALVFVFALPLLLILDPAGITGFAAITVDRPTTISVAQEFSESVVYITGINENITSLRVSGQYVGKSGFSITLIDGDNNKYVVYEHEISIPEGAVILGEASTTSEDTLPTREITFTGKCDESCSLNAAGPHQLSVDLVDGMLLLGDITYTTAVILEEVVPENEGIVEEEIVEEPVAPPEDITPPPVEIPPEPEPEPEVVTDVPSGGRCNDDSMCSSGICLDNVFEGAVQSGRCLDSRSVCVADEEPFIFVGGSIVGDSTCYANEQGSVWLANNGRYEVHHSDGSILGVIDKYGSMIIAGSLIEGTTPGIGWTVQDSNNVTVIALTTTGDLELSQGLFERTSPVGEGTHIVNTDGVIQAALTNTGSVSLRGDFLSGTSVT